MISNNEWVTAKYIIVCTDPHFDEPWPCDDAAEARAVQAEMDSECSYAHYRRELS